MCSLLILFNIGEVMENIILVLYTLLILIQFVLTIIFYRQSQKYDRQSIILIIGLLFGIFASILSIVITLGLSTDLSRLMLGVELILYSLEYVMIYFHFNLSQRDDIVTYHSLILFAVYGIFILQTLKYMFSEFSAIDETIWDVSYNFTGIISFFYASFVLYKSYKFSGEREALAQSIASLLLVIGFIVGILTTPVIRNLIAVNIDNIISDILKIIGGLTFVGIYAYNADYVERLSINTYGILIFDKSGRELVYYNVKTRTYNDTKGISVDTALFAGLITALLSFIKEVLGAKTYISKIESDDMVSMFKVGNRIGVSLITDRSTKLLRKSLNMFNLKCDRYFETLSNDDYIFGNFDYDKIKQIFNSQFPYIEVISDTSQK